MAQVVCSLLWLIKYAIKAELSAKKEFHTGEGEKSRKKSVDVDLLISVWFSRASRGKGRWAGDVGLLF